jgi:probable phosphoglycerate mutase
MNGNSQEPCRLVLVRHGETLWNVAKRMQGHGDSAFTDRGRRQVEAAARRMPEFKPAHLYTSDLGRAVQTAESIGRTCGLTPMRREGLRERNLGVFEGLTQEEVADQWPEEWPKLQEHHPEYAPPKGESVRERFDRTILAMEAIARMHPGETVAVVCHGGGLDSVFRRCVDMPLEHHRRTPLPNASINVVACDGADWVLICWGDVAHLEMEPTLEE